jgi:predicted DCC family thiol-disulfide oxidoreductase YuxK
VSDESGVAPNDYRYTVIYDGECRVCLRSIDLLRRWDRAGALELVPFQADEVRKRFPSIPESDFLESMQVVDRAGRRWQGAAGIEELLGALPKGRLVSWLFRIPLVRPLAQWVYRRVARNRMRFGCGDHCAVGKGP